VAVVEQSIRPCRRRIATEKVAIKQFYRSGIRPVPAPLSKRNGLRPQRELGGVWSQKVGFTSLTERRRALPAGVSVGGVEPSQGSTEDW
jgi:hypothetical protein